MSSYLLNTTVASAQVFGQLALCQPPLIRLDKNIPMAPQADGLRLSPLGHYRIQHSRPASAGKARIHLQGQALPSVGIHHAQHSDRTPALRPHRAGSPAPTPDSPPSNLAAAVPHARSDPRPTGPLHLRVKKDENLDARANEAAHIAAKGSHQPPDPTSELSKRLTHGLVVLNRRSVPIWIRVWIRVGTNPTIGVNSDWLLTIRSARRSIIFCCSSGNFEGRTTLSYPPTKCCGCAGHTLGLNLDITSFILVVY